MRCEPGPDLQGVAGNNAWGPCDRGRGTEGQEGVDLGELDIFLGLGQPDDAWKNQSSSS